MPDQNTARTVAQSLAEQDLGTEGSTLSASDVVFGFWDQNTGSFDSSNGTVNAVKITMRRMQVQGNPLNLFFAPLIGTDQVDVQATSIAMYDTALCGPLVGIDWVRIPGDPTTDSYRSDDGPYVAQAPRDSGIVCSDGPITVSGSAVVNGDAHPGSGDPITLNGGAAVTGSMTSRLRPLNMPAVDDTAMAANNDNASLPGIPRGNRNIAVPDAQGNFSASAGATYTIQPGDYHFKDFTLSGQSTSNIIGPTTIYITGDLKTAGGDLFNHSKIPSNLRIFMTGGTGSITAGVDFYGIIYAPNTDLKVTGSGQFYGAAVGKTLTMSGTGDVHFDESRDVSSEVPLPKRLSLVE